MISETDSETAGGRLTKYKSPKGKMTMSPENVMQDIRSTVIANYTIFLGQ